MSVKNPIVILWLLGAALMTVGVSVPKINVAPVIVAAGFLVLVKAYEKDRHFAVYIGSIAMIVFGMFLADRPQSLLLVIPYAVGMIFIALAVGVELFRCRREASKLPAGVARIREPISNS